MTPPHAAGAAALWLSSHASDSPATVEAGLTSSTQIPGTLSKDGTSIARLYTAGL
jgi:hypothetical protein